MLFRIKEFTRKIKKLCQNGLNKIGQISHETFGETHKGVSLFAKIVISIILGVYATEGATTQFPTGVLAALVAIIIFGILAFIEKISVPLVKLVLRLKISTIICTTILYYTVSKIIRIGDTSESATVIASTLFVLIELVFFQCLWAVIKNKKRNFFIITLLCVMLAVQIGGAIFVFGEGIPDTIYQEYVEQLPQVNQGDKTVLSEQTYEVESLTYGISESSQIKTKTVNLSNFTSYNGKLASFIRNQYWGYGISDVPIAGKLWYPTEGENHPVLFIVHGNHTMVTPSYLGYSYLAEYLASCGYVVVSVDEAFLNGYLDKGLIEENDARAILLLENIKELLIQNQNESSPLYQKIDPENIAIAGHSRGGEAVAIAALFNDYETYPDNGRIKFDYHFNIKTVIAIAPTCDQYEPGDREVQLEDINYFLIHGSNDMDVTEFMGMKQYENVKFTGEGDYRKAYLYIAGANHGQFNTEWGRYDTGIPAAFLLNTASLLNEEEQQEILRMYLKVCLDVTLRENLTNEDFLKDCENYAQNMPETVYIQGYQDSNFTTICDYEEDSVINEGTMKGSTLTGKNLIWMEKYTSFTDISNAVYADRDNYAVRLNWNHTRNATYTIELESNDALHDDSNKQYLQFDVLDLNDAAVEEKKYEALDFNVIITYDDGSESTYQLSDYKTIYPPLPVILSKVDYLFGDAVYKHHFQTVTLPLEGKASEIASIQFAFQESDYGVIMLDNIGLS